MTVKRVEVADATETLATYVRNAADSGTVVITDEGNPIAALIMLENTDFETVALSTDSEFLELIRSSRVRQAQEGGLSSAQVRRHLEIEVTSPRHSR